MTPDLLGRLLGREGLVANPVLPPAEASDPSPWFVKLLAGAGAWVAALFLYGATAALIWPLLDSAPARAAMGILVCAGCAVVTRLRPDPTGVFLPQMLLAISLAGFLLVFANPWHLPGGLAVVSLLAALMTAVLLVANPEPVHRQLMALLLVAALVVAATELRWTVPLGLLFAAAATLLWATQARWAAAGLVPILAPLAAALTAGLVLVPAIVTDPLLRSGAERAWPAWLLSAGLAVALAATLVIVIRGLPGPMGRATVPAWLPSAAVAATASVALAAASAPGVLACLLAWLLAMAAGRGALAGVALMALGWYLVRLYYGLETSLLGKGVALAVTGTVLIVLHFVVRRLARQDGMATAGIGDVHG